MGSRSENRVNAKSLDHRAKRLLADLLILGLKLTDVARRHGLPEWKVRHALRDPQEDGERAVAHELGRQPAAIWPERFDAEGTRLFPQPPENRTRFHREREGAADAHPQSQAALGTTAPAGAATATTGASA